MYFSMREKKEIFYAGVELNNGWLLSFTSAALETEYHDEVDTRRNPQFIVRAWIIATVATFIAGIQELGVRERMDNLSPVKLIVGVYAVGLFGSALAPLIAKQGYFHNESIVITWACFLVVVNILSSPFRAAWGWFNTASESTDDDWSYVMYDNDREALNQKKIDGGFDDYTFRHPVLEDDFLYSEESLPTLKRRMYSENQEMTDSVLIQINLILIVGLNLFFDVRTSRSWILPIFAVVFYGVASIPVDSKGENYGPEGQVYGMMNTLMMLVISYVAWQGRYSIEYAERAKWAEARKLKWDITAKEVQLKKEKEKILEMQTQMDIMEQTLASMEKLERSTLRRSTTVKGTNERRHLCVDCPPKCVVDASELEREKDTMKPNALLVLSMRGLSADYGKISQMAEMLREESYTLKQYHDDCIAAFPELRLFFAAPEAVATGGRTSETEYQRTMGALFAVYWLARLDSDGVDGFCNGVDEGWNTIHDTLPTDEVQDAPLNFFQMTDREKRAAFRKTMKWAEFANLIDTAGCGKVSKTSENPKAEQSKKMRTMGMLALTAFHDIMKVEDLLPTVHEDHSPYMGYEAGTLIRDHDIALSYILVHYPDLLPSFTGLHPDAQRAVMFTQSKLGFNHGWFVQAEAPPGAMLSTFKSMLAGGAASPADVAFYFLHWLTDLAGAEATPKGGAEKFVLRFPHAVLASFLWSIPYLGKLVHMTESEVVEDYLKARWQMSTPDRPLPKDRSALALLRLAAMTQGSKITQTAFNLMKKDDQELLALEMSRTGCRGQRYSTSLKGEEMGPAILVYYGPALLQRYMHDDDKMCVAVASLCEIYRAGRKLWPSRPEDAGKTVTLEISQVKATKIEDLSLPGEMREVWAAVLKNPTEGAVELFPATVVNELNEASTSYHILNFDEVGKAARNEKKKKGSRNTVTLKTVGGTTKAGGVAEKKTSEPSKSPKAMSSPKGGGGGEGGGSASGTGSEDRSLPRPSGIDSTSASVPPPPQAR
eukprot:CAMPEP_0119536304 /NCGR_PEP_ID=MMETSP1344-20130328/49166_1 /TAXON_ID=236787 /ORGANISM="Florenciella parvula, Strain CCMP2471" /LENGTH=998 /DNA_ID=CAMNT_0007578299 /DNA_START=273 /DNA_END=3269 /DNA_ORIENTATION=+